MSSIILACVYERTKINVIRFSVQKNVLEKVRNPRQSVVGFSVVFCAVCVRFARRPGVGLGEGGEPGPEAVGDREDHRADVAGADGRGEAGVHGRIRGGEGGTVPRSEDCLSLQHDALTGLQLRLTIIIIIIIILTVYFRHKVHGWLHDTEHKVKIN